MRHIFFISLTIGFLFSSFLSPASANEPSREEILEKRMSTYLQYENAVVPWYYIAAIDQFERNIQQVRKDIPKRNDYISIQFPPEYWAGAVNPDKGDRNPYSITFFGGKGLDGNGDGIADPGDDEDVLFTLVNYLSNYGNTEEDFALALWDHYQREQTVRQVLTIAKLYQHFETLEIDGHAFPMPVTHHFTYRGTWGASRGWGGRRIHEGTDIYAGYGVPVQSTSYGVIEVMGWNEYGGWRIGIRDIHNTYHYYAHLAYFNKGLKEGDIVEPRTLIGFVGSSGYGKEGTSGKFPPHLHYGMYKYNGVNEWAFDPYPFLRIWERQDRSLKRK